MEKTKIILDIDTGTDDAVALMTAAFAEEIELLGVTTVNGNQPIHITTENTLRVMDLIGSDIPVYRGCELPMVSTLTPGRKPNMPRQTPSIVEGSYLEMAPSKREPSKLHAVRYIVEELNNSKKPITVVATGPLTNLGMALRLDSDITSHIQEMVIMGGGHAIGNTTASAEFNIWADPEAARIVFGCGVPIKLVMLDATHEAYITRSEALALKELGTPAAKYASDFIIHRINGYAIYNPEMAEFDAAPVHDPLCITDLVDPKALEWTSCFLDVEIRGELCDSRTVCDVLNRSRKPANAQVSLHADRQRFVQFLFKYLNRQP